WVFRDGVDSIGHAFIIPDGTILASHQNVVLVQDTNKFRAINPEVKNFSGPFGFGLKDKGEWIRAYDSYGRLRLSVRYNDVEPWPVLAGGMGYTLELVDSTGIMNDGNNWMTGCIGGSPGRYYTSDCSGSGIADKSQITDFTVYPNPTTDKIYIIANNIIPIRITLKNLLGETVLYSEEATGQVELSLRQLPAGYYVLTVQKPDGTRQMVQIIKR
ncbi:T9SS C-terminal target domain-containing protein, partial [bacterium]